MTIYNNINNVSEDYTYVLAPEEIFYDANHINGIYEYDVAAEEWNLLEPSETRFDSTYEGLQSFIKNNHINAQLLNINVDFEDILSGNYISVDSFTPALYIGINTNQFVNFPDFPEFDMQDKAERERQYFVLVFTESAISCFFIKTFVLYSKIRIADKENFSANDLEYLSAQQTTNAIREAISKIDILTIIATTNQNKPQKQSGDNNYKIPAISSPKTNCLYLVYETTNNDNIDDGINYHFGLYIYDDDSGFFKKLDTLTFDIRDYSLDTHTHGNITRDGSLNGAGSGVPLITGTGGKIVAGTFGNNTSIRPTDFVSCADTRLSDSRVPKAHASTNPDTYGAATTSKYGHVRVIDSINNSVDAVQSKAIKAYVDDAVSNVEIDIDTAVQSGSSNPVTNDAIKQYVDRAVFDAQTQGQITIESNVVAGNNNPVSSNGIYEAIKNFKTITLVSGTSESASGLYGDADKNAFNNGAVILYRFKNNWVCSQRVSLTISTNSGSRTYNILNASGKYLQTGSYPAGKIICLVYYDANLYLIGNTNASSEQDGLLSKADKQKLDNIEAGANKIIVDTSLSSTSTNPVQNKAIYNALNNKVDKVTGKGLSTNDYTTNDKTKLANIEAGATKTIVDSSLSSSSSNPVQNQKIVAALSTKQDTSNLVNSFSSTLTTTKYPSEKLVKNSLDAKQNISNLVTSFSSTPTDTKYPSEKLVKSNLDTIKTSVDSVKTSVDAVKDDLEWGMFDFGMSGFRLYYNKYLCILEVDAIDTGGSPDRGYTDLLAYFDAGSHTIPEPYRPSTTVTAPNGYGFSLEGLAVQIRASPDGKIEVVSPKTWGNSDFTYRATLTWRRKQQ